MKKLLCIFSLLCTFAQAASLPVAAESTGQLKRLSNGLPVLIQDENLIGISGIKTVVGTTNEVTVTSSVSINTISLPSTLTFTGKTINNGSFVGGAFTGLSLPSNSSDAANKGYVDSLISGVASGIIPKGSVKAATTANITLSGAQTIDGVSIVATDRVLVKNQSTTSQNGIYVAAASTWSRATDADTAAELSINFYYFISSGTTLANTGWFIQTAPTALGTDPVVFSQFSAAQNYIAGSGLQLTGLTFNVNPTQYLDNATISYNSYLGNLLIKSDQISEVTTNAVAGINFNYDGYSGGTTQFRNINVYDGKTVLVASFTGSTKALAVVGPVTGSNLSGTNTGDNAVNSLYSGLAAAKENVITATTSADYYRGDKTFQTLNKAAVGLSNVENTALSTWAGTSSITTLGTITSGTVPVARVSGLGSLATQSGTFSGSSSGTNTGDQTNISGNAATATNVAYSGLTGTVPTWNQNTTGNASSATTVSITNDDTTAATMYPTWVTATSGNLPHKTSSAALSWNPSTKVFNLNGVYTGVGSTTYGAVLDLQKSAGNGRIQIPNEGADIYNTISSRNAANSGELPLKISASSFTANGPFYVNTLANLRATKTHILDGIGAGLNLQLNVKDYGAVGDGSANDSAAFSSAIAALTDYSTLYVPQGIYKVDTLYFTGRTHITLLGDGKGSTIIRASATPFDPGDGHGSTYGRCVLNLDATNTDFTIRGITFDGACTYRKPGQQAVLLGGNNSSFTDCGIVNSGEFAIMAGTSSGTTNINVSNNLISLNFSDGVHFLNVTQGVVANNVINGVDDDCIAMEHSYNVTISGNTCSQRNDLSTSWGRGIAVFGSSSRINVVSNTVVNTKQYGLIIDPWGGYNPSYITVSGNLFSNCAIISGATALIHNASDITISNNFFTDGASSDLLQITKGSRISVLGNTFTQNRDQYCRGIFTTDASNADTIVGLNICNNVFNFLGASTNEAINIKKSDSYTSGAYFSNVVITGNSGKLASGSNFVFTQNMDGATCKVYNNTAIAGGIYFHNGTHGGTTPAYGNNN